MDSLLCNGVLTLTKAQEVRLLLSLDKVVHHFDHGLLWCHLGFGRHWLSVAGVVVEDLHDWVVQVEAHGRRFIMYFYLFLFAAVSGDVEGVLVDILIGDFIAFLNLSHWKRHSSVELWLS